MSVSVSVTAATLILRRIHNSRLPGSIELNASVPINKQTQQCEVAQTLCHIISLENVSASGGPSLFPPSQNSGKQSASADGVVSS